jgi:hypothetical protein
MKKLIAEISSVFFLAISLIGCRQIFGEREIPDLILHVPDESSKIIITSPPNGSVWKHGDTIEIKWIAASIKRVSIQLFRKSDYKLTLADDLENTGYFNWTVPTNIPSSNHYSIKVLNSSDKNVFELSGRFSIQ